MASEIIQLPQNGGNQNGGTTLLPVSNGGGLFGNNGQLTFFGGSNVTVADLTGTGVLLVFNDKYNGILQLLSTPAPATT